MDAVHTWKVEIQLFEHDDDTAADAVLTTTAGNTIRGRGRARRNPSDQDVPEIGEEVAASRALRDLADRLLNTASEDISEIEHESVHLYR